MATGSEYNEKMVFLLVRVIFRVRGCTSWFGPVEDTDDTIYDQSQEGGQYDIQTQDSENEGAVARQEGMRRIGR